MMGNGLTFRSLSAKGDAIARIMKTKSGKITPEKGPSGIALAMKKHPCRMTTIHRLLGARGISTRFRHDAEHPLPHDVVVIDEASMVSLQLTARLLEAIRPDARVILIGDPDQLASVEAGSVLGDIVAVVRIVVIVVQLCCRMV